MPKRTVQVSIGVEQMLQHIGKALRRARIARGYSQTMAANQVGVHTATISRIESGQTEVSAGALLEYMSMLGREPALRQLAQDDEQTQRLLSKAVADRAPPKPRKRKSHS